MLRLGDFIVMKGGNKEETCLKEVGKGGEEEQRGYKPVQSLSSPPLFPFNNKEATMATGLINASHLHN